MHWRSPVRNTLGEFCIIAFLCISSLAIADELPSHPPNAHDAAVALHEVALEHLRSSNDSKQAREELNKVLQLDPAYAPALFNLGVLSEREEQWTVARDYYDRAANSPDLQIAEAARVRAARVRRVIDLNGSLQGRRERDYEAALVHANDAVSQKHPRDALAVLLPLIQAQPDRWEALGLAGVVYAGESDTTEAIRYLRAAGTMAPQPRRFDQAIGMLLGVDRKFLKDLSASGPSAEPSPVYQDPARGIPEAEAFLIVRDVPGATHVLAEIAQESSPRAAEAKRMLRDLAPQATLAAASAPVPDQRQGLRFQSLTLDGEIVRALLPEIVSDDMKLLANSAPQFMEPSVPTTVAANITTTPAIQNQVTQTPGPPAEQTTPAETSPTTPPTTTGAHSARELFVQTGSFPDQPHAEAMVAELKQKEFAASFALEHGKYRVFVGPVQSAKQAHAMAEKLQHHGYPDAFIRARQLD